MFGCNRSYFLSMAVKRLAVYSNEGGREGGREGERERGRERGREGGREGGTVN